ncbi:hypothetical protein B0H10DRAFT_2016715 [Mycena sp. CBHHK59/15]|nr:hypothetical protein B0H10DRAFT_2016715 [Mycena sp. CBHHK59/15]
MLVAARRSQLVVHAASFSTKRFRGPTKPPPSQGFDAAVDPVLFLRLRQRIIERHNPTNTDLVDPQTDVFNRIIFDIRRGLDNGEISVLRASWQKLRRMKHLHVLTRPVLEQIGKFVTTSLLPTHSGDERWSSASRSFVEEVALTAAAAHSTDALNACFLAYIKRRDPEAVFELYEKFNQIPEATHVSDAPDLASNEDIAVLASESRPGRVNVLLAVTAAYAMRDCFQEALKEYLDTAIKFRRYTTDEFLQNLSYDPMLQNKVKIFVQRLEVARTVARAPSLSKHVHNLSLQPASPLLENLYNSILDGMTEPEAYIAADPKLITSTKSVAMSEIAWASFLAAFLRRDRKDLAGKLWKDMSHFGIVPGTLTWNMVLTVYSDRGATQEAMSAWDTMRTHNVKPDAVSYRALISTLFVGKRLDDALRWFLTFEKEGKLTSSGEQTLTVYNTVLHGLLHAGRDNANTAFTLMRKMEDVGPKPDIVSYNTVLSYHGRQGDFKAMAAVINRMSSANIKGDVFTFSTILSAMLKAGRDDAPEMILNLMRKQGVQASVATYSAIIHQQMQVQNAKNLQAAMRLLEEMENDPDVQPNEVTYTSILAGLYRGNWLSPGQAEIYRRDIITRMAKRHIKLKPWGYSILIKACLGSEEEAGLEDALKFYRDMFRNNVSLTDDTWYVLLAGLISRGEWRKAEEVVSDMFACGAHPGSSVLRLVSKIRQRRGN